MAAAAPRATVAARRAAARCARGRVGRGGFRAAAARRRPLAAATGGESGESGEAEGEASPVKNPYGEEMPSWYTEEMRAADEALILQQLAEGTEEKRAAQAERAEFRKQFGDLLGQGACSRGAALAQRERARPCIARVARGRVERLRPDGRVEMCAWCLAAAG